MTRLDFDSLLRRRGPVLWIVFGVVAVALGAGGMYLAIGRGHEPVATPEQVAGQQDEGEGALPGTVRLSAEKQRMAAIRVAPVRRSDLTETVRVTGKITLNEDQIAHIHPLVAGRAHEVPAKFGDQVKKGQVLAVIDSQQVGRAKLNLYKSERATRLAQVNYDWQKMIHQNTLALINALKKGVSITEIEQKFRDRPMGEYRDQLLGAYADLQKAQADYERLSDVTERGIVAGKQLLAATAARDVTRAKFAGDLEQIRFLAERNKIAAQQELEKAQTTETVNRELLEILGYKDIQDKDIDPAIQGEAISHYQVRAPFGGTVISKDIVLMDYVDPTTEMFSIADFSTVWVSADIYEKYVSLLSALGGTTIRFRADAYPDRQFEAKVFYTGNIIGEKTRKADLRAIVENPDGVLKPGMFVEIELSGAVVPNVVQVPRSAVVERAGETFVFVPKEAGIFERRNVQTGRSAGDSIEIVSGLKEGEPVVVAGGFALKSELLSEFIGEEE